LTIRESAGCEMLLRTLAYPLLMLSKPQKWKGLEVNSPTQIVANILTKVHEEKCQDGRECHHEIELLRIWEQDKVLTDMVKAGNKEYRLEVIDALERARRKLVNPEEIEPESYAEWINSIFNLAIKSVKEIK